MLEKERISRIAVSLSRQSEPSRAAKMPKFGMLASWLPTGWGGSGGRVAHCRDDHAATVAAAATETLAARLLLLCGLFASYGSGNGFLPAELKMRGLMLRSR
jgi:hypothetical protein